MTTPDMDVIKEIPGYKVILKAILKCQIQQLVEQLASHTDEESIILTASVSDGTLSHLGSDSGKNFLDDHEDVKSQFLGFCLKHHHRKKQLEKEKLERQREEEQRQRMMPTTPTRFSPGARPGFMPQRSPRHFSPRFPSPRMQIRPYPVGRPSPKRPQLSFNQPMRSPGMSPGMRMPIDGGAVIKIEADDDSDSNHTQTETNITQNSADGGAPTDSSQPSSPSLNPTSQSPRIKSESSDRDDDAKSEHSSTSTIPNEASDLIAPPSGLSLDSDLSNLISGDQTIPTPMTLTSAGAGPPGTFIDPNVNVKIEAITESEMELEITGVEPGRVMPQMGTPQHDTSNWGGNMPGGMGFDPSQGASGSEADMEGYNYAPPINEEQLVSRDQNQQMNQEPQQTKGSTPVHPRVHVCPYCNKQFAYKSGLNTHVRTHTKEKPYVCDICQVAFTENRSLKCHVLKVHQKVKL